MKRLLDLGRLIPEPVDPLEIFRMYRTEPPFAQGLFGRDTCYFAPSSVHLETIPIGIGKKNPDGRNLHEVIVPLEINLRVP